MGSVCTEDKVSDCIHYMIAQNTVHSALGLLQLTDCYNTEFCVILNFAILAGKYSEINKIAYGFNSPSKFRRFTPIELVFSALFK